jgi:ubiquinone/menaquinone biosynthesis C-methylase UbiE
MPPATRPETARRPAAETRKLMVASGMWRPPRITEQKPAGDEAVSDFDEELKRAREAYAARATNQSYARLYSSFAPSNLLTIQNREWIVADLLRRSGLWSLADLDILDVGCGSGAELRRMTTTGADPARCVGIDLMADRIERARQILPAARFVVGSAHQLPFPDASFDLVSQFVVFSSIVHHPMRQAIAREMIRVLRPDGRILWYDMRSVKPAANLVPIDLDELKALFPGCSMAVRSATLAWRPSHFLAPKSRVAAILMEALPPARSHYVALIRPAGAATAR